jgi:hypothetical protein
MKRKAQELGFELVAIQSGNKPRLKPVIKSCSADVVVSGQAFEHIEFV